MPGEPRRSAKYELAPGDTLGKYEILRKLAVGGMAELYLARIRGNAGFEKVVVLKRILPQVAEDASFVQMFLEEARLAGTLNHPNIAHVYDVGEVDGQHFFTMEFVHGQDVRSIRHELKKDSEVVPLGVALAVVHGTAAALDYAHERTGPDGKLLGLVHRDVSASNVMVSYDGAIKLLDFGIARAASSTHKTQVGTLKGKVPYMSPEQCKGHPLDRRSDLFSLGIVMFELTVGRRPFRGESDFAVMDQIVYKGAPRPSSIVTDYPERLEAIVMKLLERDPKARYTTGEELIEDIDAFIQSAGLWMSPTKIGKWMRGVFAEKIRAWEDAEQQGVSFAQHVAHSITSQSQRSELVTPPSAFPGLPSQDTPAPETVPEKGPRRASAAMAAVTPPKRTSQPMAAVAPPQRTSEPMAAVTPKRTSEPMAAVAPPPRTSQPMAAVAPPAGDVNWDAPTTSDDPQWEAPTASRPGSQPPPQQAAPAKRPTPRPPAAPRAAAAPRPGIFDVPTTELDPPSAEQTLERSSETTLERPSEPTVPAPIMPLVAPPSAPVAVPAIMMPHAAPPIVSPRGVPAYAAPIVPMDMTGSAPVADLRPKSQRTIVFAFLGALVIGGGAGAWALMAKSSSAPAASLGSATDEVHATPTPIVEPPKPAPAKAEAPKPAPAKVEAPKPAKVEALKPEPAKAEAPDPEPAKVEAPDPEPAKVEPAKPEPAKVEPAVNVDKPRPKAPVEKPKPVQQQQPVIKKPVKPKEQAWDPNSPFLPGQ